MRVYLLIVGILLTSACQSGARNGGHGLAPDGEMACTPSNDPMGCVRQRCDQAGAHFDENQKLCLCPEGSLLSTVGAYQCVTPKFSETDSGYVVSSMNAKADSRSYPYYLSGPDRSTMQDLIAQAGSSLTQFPALGLRLQVVDIYKNADEMRSLKLDPDSMHDLAESLLVKNLLLLPDLNLPVNANGGISDATLGLNYDIIAVPPSDQPIETGHIDLDQVIQESVSLAQAGTSGEKIISFTEDGCADQCIGRTDLVDDPSFHSYRTREFFKGALVRDQISIFDRHTRQTAVVLFLMGQRVNQFLLREGNDLWLHANQPGDLSNSRVARLVSLPKKGDVTPFALDANEVPVVTLESALTTGEQDASIPRGPFTESHVYGWFKTSDDLPYFKNFHALPTVFGEEEIETPDIAAQHGIVVTSLASGGFKHAFIPFAGSDLLNGIFKKFLGNYAEVRPNLHLVISLSELWSLSPAACAGGPLGEAVMAHADQVLWVMGASNSASEFSLHSNACPQTLTAPNLLKVAATADGLTLAHSSAYGEKTVSIAESGCAGDERTCADADAATSFAAPRLARKMADLLTRFSEATPKDVAFAILATAHIPRSYWGKLEPLPVISGGVADVDAAALLLSSQAQWPVDRNLVSPQWLALLKEAKINQYQGRYSWLISKYVEEEAKIFMKRGNVQ